MKRATVLLLCAAAVLFLSGCIPAVSLHRFFPEKDEIFDSALIATWVSKPDDKPGAEYSHPKYNCEIIKEDNHYSIKVTEKEVTVYFTGYLGQIGKIKILDLHIRRFEGDLQKNLLANSSVLIHLFPVHSVARLELNEDALKVKFLGREWVDKKVKNNELKIPVEMGDNDSGSGYVLSASSEQLKGFLSENIDTPGAFGGAEEIDFELVRQK